MSNISDWFAWDCEGSKNQFVSFLGIMGTKNGNLWCQKPKKKGLYSQFQKSAAPLKVYKFWVENITIKHMDFDINGLFYTFSE